MPIPSLEPLEEDILRIEGIHSLENIVDFTFTKDFPISLELDDENHLDVIFSNKTDLTMNGATSDQTSVKAETANFAQFNQFLSNDKVSNGNGLEQLLANRIAQETEAMSFEVLSPVPSPMSTTLSSEPSSPFSISNMSSPMTEDSSHLSFDGDTIDSWKSYSEYDSNNDPGYWEPKAKMPRISMRHLPPKIPVEGFDFGPALSNTSFLCTEDVSTEIANLPVMSERSNTTSTKHATHRKLPKSNTRKPPSLNLTFPNKSDGAELSILVQPEKHHRARYLTEGSRGSVKDDSQQSFPTLKLDGVQVSALLHIFVASDQGKIKPHGYYQACKVTGRNTTPCKEIDVDGTTVIEIPWEYGDKMEMGVDCVGILKLRNSDVEQRIGLARSKRKSTTVRLVFRVSITQPNGSVVTLQEVSSPICCTQPLGHPEIIKKSLTSCSVKGEEELFIIGKNFIAKHTKAKLQELCPMGKILWEGNCEIDRSLFHNTHIVCKLPPYKTMNIDRPKEVYLVVSSGANKSSELYAHPINYMPSNEPEKECVTVRHSVPVMTTTLPSQNFAALLTQVPQAPVPTTAPSCPQPVPSYNAGTSFADRLKTAAQLELNHPGLFAKLANASSLLGFLCEPSAADLLGPAQTVFNQTIYDEEIPKNNEINCFDIEEESCSEASSTDNENHILLSMWAEQASAFTTMKDVTLDDVSSVLPL